MMVRIVEHRDETLVDFVVEEEAASSTPQVPNRPVPGTAIVHTARQEHCQQPGSCCDTLQAPRPHQGP
jgi:hypothetical protein